MVIKTKSPDGKNKNKPFRENGQKTLLMGFPKIGYVCDYYYYYYYFIIIINNYL